MSEPFFPIAPGGSVKKCGCPSGPTKIGDGTGRKSENVVSNVGDDEAIVRAYSRNLNSAAEKAMKQAAQAIKDTKLVCDEGCISRIIVTLSDYRVQEETGQSAVGPLNIAYLVSAEVDWTAELYCFKGEAPQFPKVPTGPSDVGPAEEIDHQSPTGGQVKITLREVHNGCTSRWASGKGEGSGVSRPPSASAAKAEEEAKGEALEDMASQINEIEQRIRCDKRCKKQKTTIEIGTFKVTSKAAPVYGGLAGGFEATASVEWALQTHCSEP